MNLLFEESAVNEVLKLLHKQGYRWDNIRYINHNRYAIVMGKPNIAILLKGEPFFNFGVKFREAGEKGVGDSINCEALKLFIQRDVREVYTMFRDGKIYKAFLQSIVNRSHKWKQKEGTEVRSFSIHLYKRVN